MLYRLTTYGFCFISNQIEFSQLFKIHTFAQIFSNRNNQLYTSVVSVAEVVNTPHNARLLFNKRSYCPFELNTLDCKKFQIFTIYNLANCLKCLNFLTESVPLVGNNKATWSDNIAQNHTEDQFLHSNTPKPPPPFRQSKHSYTLMLSRTQFLNRKCIILQSTALHTLNVKFIDRRRSV